MLGIGNNVLATKSSQVPSKSEPNTSLNLAVCDAHRGVGGGTTASSSVLRNSNPRGFHKPSGVVASGRLEDGCPQVSFSIGEAIRTVKHNNK